MKKEETPTEVAPSHALLARYMNNDRTVTLDDVRRQEQKDNFNYLLNKWSFKKNKLKKIVYLPLLVYFFLFKESD